MAKRSVFFKIKRRISLFLVNRVFVGTKHFAAKRRLLRASGIAVGENTRIVGPLHCTGHLTIGDGCWIGRNFHVEGNGEVTIGNHCDIAPDVSFYTGSHEIGTTEHRAGPGLNFCQTVGDGTWICARVSICNDVTIGHGCVIAAAACVVSDVPDDTLVGGVPAREIRKLDR